MAEFDGVVHGLDGGTPLGFLAGVGLQRVLSARFLSVTLAWRLLDAWRPVIQGVASFDSIIDGVLEDADRWRNSALLQFRYLKQEKRGPTVVQGLRAPIGVLRAWLSQRRRAGDEEAIAHACALMCEAANEVLDALVPSEVARAIRFPSTRMDRPAACRCRPSSTSPAGTPTFFLRSKRSVATSLVRSLQRPFLTAVL